MQENIVGGGKLHQQYGRDRGLRYVEIGDLLWRSIFKQPEVVFLESRNKLSTLGCYQDIHVHQRHIYLDGIVRQAFYLVGRSRRRGWWRSFSIFFGDGVGANVAGGTARFGRGLLLRLSVVVLRLAGRRLRLVLSESRDDGSQEQHSRRH